MGAPKRVQRGRKIIKWLAILLIVSGLFYGGARLILAGYSVSWTGFADYVPTNSSLVRGKTLWDWLELLIIPLVLAGGALYLDASERAVERQAAEDRAKLEREIATDRQQEAALQAYLDRMSDLLLKEDLRVSSNDEMRNVARIRTLTVLRGLDAKRKGIVLLFLYESGLIAGEPIISLREADLSGADLAKATLAGADLTEVNMSGTELRLANLSGAKLVEADLNDASMFAVDLRGADLNLANLTGADLESANLSGANLMATNLQFANLRNSNCSDEQLRSALLRLGLVMPDGTKIIEP